MRNRAFHRSIAISFGFILLAAALLAQTPAPNQSDKQLNATAAGVAQPMASAANQPHDNTFIIGNDDVLSINVWKEPDISRSIPVRSDGKISLPLVGEVQATGRTPLQLETEIAGKLKAYIAVPEVTVMVQQINSEKFNILGQVVKPGAYPLTNGSTILDAIATAGGFRDFAKKKGVYVLRQGGGSGEEHLAFNYNDVIKGKNLEQNVKLKAGDTIIVP
ncbi:polysaccharide biosynthesis/export family protein [Acidobacterium sp. S8]|uniref:polysaccharide biosynthesis/export family protein n=1 Tax=Acidobacterium sp. S8 TaxID=1641854 RepID=UPI00131C7ED5|nr:polysaccharide biosynthesis/export family protein [Acidobacterium sp. S8]